MAKITDLQALRKKRSRKRAVRRLAIFTVVIGMVFAVMYGLDYFEKNDLGQEIDSYFSMFTGGDGYPVAIGGTKVLDLEDAGGNLAMLTRNSLVTYNGQGAEVSRIKQSYFNANVICSRSRTLLYDRGGKKFSVYSGDRLSFEREFPRSIYCAAMGESGTVAVATRSATHTAEVKVYNRRGEEIFGWLSAEGHVIGLALPKSGNSMAAATLDTNGGQLVSSVHLFDFAQDEARAHIDLPDELILHLYYMGKDNNLYVITDRTVYEISSSTGTVMAQYSYNGRTLWAYSADRDVITLALGDYTEQRELEILRLTPGFTEVPRQVINEHLIALASDSTYTYVLTDNLLTCFDSAMALVDSYETPDAKQIQVIDHRVYYATGDRLEMLVPQPKE